MKIIMLGAPGAGKGTQARMISEKYGILEISTGDIFRANIRDQTELGKKARAYMDRGELVPDDVTCSLVVDRIVRDDCSNGYILDGFPRTVPQAEALSRELEEQGTKIDFALDVEVPDDRILERLSGRFACPNCGATYHILFRKPRKDGICDDCATELVQREDDRPDAVRERLIVYRTQTRPLINYYRERGCMYSVDGTLPADKVFEEICRIIDR